MEHESDQFRRARRSGLRLQAVAARGAMGIPAGARCDRVAHGAASRAHAVRTHRPRPAVLSSGDHADAPLFSRDMGRRTDRGCRSPRPRGRACVEQETKDQAYGAFIRELHRRIAAAGAQPALVTGSPGISLLARARDLRRGIAGVGGAHLAGAAIRRLGGCRLRGRIPRLVPVAERQLLPPQPAGQLSTGRAAGRAGAARVMVVSSAPPAPSTWRSAPRGRHWSRGNRCGRRAAAADASS